MSRSTPRFDLVATVIAFLAIFLLLCTGGCSSPTEPSNPPSPLVKTATPTATPIATATPAPSTLAGTIWLVNKLGARTLADRVWVSFSGRAFSSDEFGRYDFGAVPTAPGTLSVSGALGFKDAKVAIAILPGPNVVDVEMRQ